MIWTVREILKWTTQKFSELDFSTPLLDAQLLLGHVLNTSKIKLYTEIDRVLTDAERNKMRDLVKRHMQGEPVAYLLNQKYWHDLDLHVDSRVLIPRPETETLLDFTLSLWKGLTVKPQIILDLCTGSGCLAIALAKIYTNATVVGVDISSEALEVAELNAQRNKVKNVQWICADVTGNQFIESVLLKYGKVDILVANPPYISKTDWEQLDLNVRDFEPALALVAEDNGLAIGKSIYKNVLENKILNSNSIFMMEMGENHPELIVNECQFTENSNVHPNGFSAISAQTPAWKVQRGESISVRDFENKARFLCLVNGLLERSSVAELQGSSENYKSAQSAEITVVPLEEVKFVDATDSETDEFL